MDMKNRVYGYCSIEYRIHLVEKEANVEDGLTPFGRARSPRRFESNVLSIHALYA